MAIPADRNVLQKEAEEKLKYNSLCTETQRMWNLKYTIIPLISGANKRFWENSEAVPEKNIQYS